jgi:hypothetical protein
MVEPTGMRAARRRERLAFHQAGHAVVATTFGFRYGALSLHADLALETAHTGPLGIDLWKCSFPPNQQERVLQVLTMLWAGTAAEVRCLARRVTPETDPDRPTVDHFADLLRERNHDVTEQMIHRGRLDAYSLMRLPRHLKAVETVAATLMSDELIGHFTVRTLISDIINTPSRRVSTAVG